MDMYTSASRTRQVSRSLQARSRTFFVPKSFTCFPSRNETYINKINSSDYLLHQNWWGELPFIFAVKGLTKRLGLSERITPKAGFQET